MTDIGKDITFQDVANEYCLTPYISIEMALRAKTKPFFWFAWPHYVPPPLTHINDNIYRINDYTDVQ